MMKTLFTLCLVPMAIAGAGIIASSDPESEYAETELKFRPIREALSR